MTNCFKILIVLIFAVGFSVFACQSNDPKTKKSANSSPAPEKQIYKSTGVIKAIDVSGGKLTIDHEEISGYMSAMEMSETVRDKSLLSRVKTGDKVEFEIERTGAEIVFTKLTVISEGALLNGGEIYKTNCAKCHGATGTGAKKGIALTKGHALAHTETEHIKQVTDGEGAEMPAFKDKLSREEIAAVVKFVREELQKDATSAQRKGHHH